MVGAGAGRGTLRARVGAGGLWVGAKARARLAWCAAVRRVRRARRLREIKAGRTILRSPPATINIEFSGRCNVWPPCTYCVGKNAPGYQEPPHIPEEQLAPYWPHMLAAERVNDNTYGEPLMYPGIHDVIDRLGRAGVQFGFTTNGLLLSEKKARLLARHGEHVNICISFNAASKEVYFAHQGKDFDKLVANVERLVRIHRELRPRESPPVVLSFIVMRSNQHEVMDFIRLGWRLGVRGVLLRHLFELGESKFEAANFGHHFVYGQEMLTWEEYGQIERQVRASEEFKRAGLQFYFAWNGRDGFIKQQAEPGVDIPCLFPWKFLCIRPLHGFYTPCVYLKKGIARIEEASVEEAWNGPVMRELRGALAKGEVPRYCMEHSENCPLVLEERAKRRKAGDAAETAAEPTGAVHERRVALPVLS